MRVCDADARITALQCEETVHSASIGVSHSAAQPFDRAPNIPSPTYRGSRSISGRSDLVRLVVYQNITSSTLVAEIDSQPQRLWTDLPVGSPAPACTRSETVGCRLADQRVVASAAHCPLPLQVGVGTTSDCVCQVRGSSSRHCHCHCHCRGQSLDPRPLTAHSASRIARHWPPL